ncbi:MAG: galactokinase, partial [Clostridiaceae bacterium]|nr:galactokinase [Clostridiaceae bacterium]
AISSHLLEGQGACRVHGGGFAGTIQAFVPQDLMNHYAEGMRAVFGEDAVADLNIRNIGSCRIDL